MELIKTYQSKNQLAQVITSSAFHRRQEEAEAVIDSALSCLQVSFPWVYSYPFMQVSLLRVQSVEDTTIVSSIVYGLAVPFFDDQ